MSLPSREKCLALLKKHGLSEGMVRHSLAVERVAVFLAKKLREAGEQVDVELVSRAALLHDVDKTKTLEAGFRHLHGQISKQILEEEGFPIIGEIAAKHYLYKVLEENPFSSWEEKLVVYADKRVNHDQVVSLDERFQYLLENYGNSEEKRDKIAACKPFIEKLEKEIFSKINASPDLEDL